MSQLHLEKFEEGGENRPNVIAALFFLIKIDGEQYGMPFLIIDKNSAVLIPIMFEESQCRLPYTV